MPKVISPQYTYVIKKLVGIKIRIRSQHYTKYLHIVCLHKYGVYFKTHISECSVIDPEAGNRMLRS